MKKANFITELNFKINSFDFICLRTLYTPIIGKNAVILYSLIHDYHIINKNNRTYFEFNELANILSLSEEELIIERKKLEAVGLLRTYERADNYHFIFHINKPLAPEQFRKNSLLYKDAIKKIGEIVFERIEFSNKQRDFSKDDFQDITVKYQDLFEISYQKHETQTQSTLEIALDSNQSKESAIKSLTSAQFIKYLTSKKVSPSQLLTIQRLKNLGLSSRSLNLIIDYSFEINGKIVSNHIKVIAHDLTNKDLKDSYDIEQELILAKKSKKSSIKTKFVEDKNESKDENIDWDKLFNSIGGF